MWDVVQNQTNATEIRDRAVQVEMRSFRDVELLKIALDMITPGEVRRVTVWAKICTLFRGSFETIGRVTRRSLKLSSLNASRSGSSFTPQNTLR